MNLTKDTLLYIASKLDLPDLLNFSNIDERINDIWLYKIRKEFPNYKFETEKEIYQRLYWENLKNKLKFLGTVEELLNTKILSLSGNQLTEIPKEIGNLHNLQILYLSHNQLTEIPKEIGNLDKLQYLDLDNNQLTEIPKEIGNLKKLQTLVLQNNQLTEIPKEVRNIPRLRILE